MRNKKCECGKDFLVPDNNTERQIILDREKPLELIFADIDIRISRAFLFQWCSDCSRSRSLKLIEPFIKNDDNNIVVNWKQYVEQEYSFRYLNNVFIRLNIFSGYAKGHWIVMSQTNGCINPMFEKGVNLYFVSPDDALSFARASKAKRCYIMKISDVIST